jgi:hypothetical protein
VSFPVANPIFRGAIEARFEKLVLCLEIWGAKIEKPSFFVAENPDREDRHRPPTPARDWTERVS